MSQAIQCDRRAVVELAKGVFVQTSIPSTHHSALRSGFAGYPANPRWSVTKFRAWRAGQQWRRALDSQQMVVREADSLLVPTAEAQATSTATTTTPDSKPRRPTWRNWLRQKLPMCQTAEI